MATSRYLPDRGLTARMVFTMFLLGLLFVAAKDIRKVWLHQLIAVALLIFMIVGILLHIDDWKISL